MSAVLPCPAVTVSVPQPSDVASLQRVSVLLIGSGPASLSLLLRVLRPGLSDLWSDDESQRGGRHAEAHGKDEEDEAIDPQLQQQQPTRSKNSAARTARATADSGNTNRSERSAIEGMTAQQIRDSILVVDPLEGWCSLWDRHFAALQISHLRSSVMAHACPIDPQSMRSFAARHQREEEVRTLMAADSVAQSTNKQIQRKREKQLRRISRQQANALCAAQTSGLSSSSDAPSSSPPSANDVSDSSSLPLFRRVTQSVSVWPRSALYDLAVPSSALFRDFNRELVREGKLDDMRIRDTVQHIATVQLEGQGQWYLVTLASGRRLLAHAVVCGVGNSVPRWPEWARTHKWRRQEEEEKKGEGTDSSKKLLLPPHALLHSSELVRRCFAEGNALDASTAQGPVCIPGGVGSQLPSKPSATGGRLLVIGGGLTSAQLACQVLSCTSKWQVDWTLRGWARVKAFDVDTEWVSPSTATMCMAHFHALDDVARLKAASAGGRTAEEKGKGNGAKPYSDPSSSEAAAAAAAAAEAKLRAIRAARQGGSITQEANEIVQRWRNKGRLLQREHTEVQGAEWVPSAQAAAGKAADAAGYWRVQLVCTPPAHSDCPPDAPVLETVEYDAIWLCTGSMPDARQHAFLRDLCASHQLHAASGVPIVDEQLLWLPKTAAPASVTAAEAAAAATPPAPAAALSCVPGRFHFVGGLACLHLGPDAFNLRGAQAASRNLFETVRGYVAEQAGLGTRSVKRQGQQQESDSKATQQPQSDATTDEQDAAAQCPLSVSPPVVSPRSASRPASSSSSFSSSSSSCVSLPMLRPNASSRRNQLTRGAKCLECNLARGDSQRVAKHAGGVEGNPFQLLGDE